MPDRQQRWLYLIPFAVAIGVLMPFAHKAFTIDDTLFLLQAKQILRDPLHPTAFDVVWDKNVWMRCSAIMPSGPVQAFLLVPAVLVGGSEIVAHGVQLLIVCIGLIGIIRLARALGLSRARATLAATIASTSPCFLGMASTVMPDVPAMAFGVLTLDAALRWKRDERWLHAFATTVFGALAALSRPHAAGYLGVAFVFLADVDKGRHLLRAFSWRWKLVLPLAAAAGLVGLYGSVSRDPTQGATLATATAGLAGWVQPERHFIANLSHWALTTPVVALFVLFQRRRLDWFLVPLTVVPLCALVVGLGYEKQAWIGVAAAFSLATLVGLFRNPARYPLAIHLGLVACLLMPLPLVVYVHLPPKYLVTSLPAAALIVAGLDVPRVHVKLFRAAVAAVLLGFLLVSYRVLQADSAFAELGRRAASELVRPLVQSGEQVWFTGHWGFQWYALAEGARPLTLRDTPRPRDYLVGPSGAYDGGPVADNFQNKSLVRKLGDNQFTLFTMKQPLGAGFYSNWWGLLPVASGFSELEEFSVWQFAFSTVDP